MLGIPLAFNFPLVLAALCGLPALYFLLRLTPPRPRRVPFPPLRLIFDLRPRVETPFRTPWWLLILRLSIAALVIVAMAGPVLNPLPAVSDGGGPLIVVIDDGWPAAPSWDARIAAAYGRIEAAERRFQPIAIMAISDAGREIVLADSKMALQRLRTLKPVPFVPDRLDAVGALEKFAGLHSKSEILWFCDGLEAGHAQAFAQRLASLQQPVSVIGDTETVRALSGPRNEAAGLGIRVLRSRFGGSQNGQLRAFDLKGLPVAEAEFDFGASRQAEVLFELPIEVRNEISRLEISGERSAAAVSLLDSSRRRRRIGLVTGETTDLAQPLLSPNYYLVRALAPFADVREVRLAASEPISGLIDEQVAVMVLADVGVVSGSAHDALARFVEGGGVLVRFAGTRLAAASDDLVPVRLRRGGRVLGGSMSWDTPKQLGAFDRQSPFFGLIVPAEVTINRQVLAEPEPGLSSKTWAHLADGTPLVTAARQGKGLSVLFHVTADTTWSTLPLSGLFVDMLHKIVSLSGATPEETSPEPGESTSGAMVAPHVLLDGFGRLEAPSPLAKAVPAGFEGAADATHLPGFYGQPPDSLVAVNTLRPGDTIDAADFSSLELSHEPLSRGEPVDLKPWLLGAAVFLLLLDGLVSFRRLGGPWSRGVHAGLILVIFGSASFVALSRAEAEVGSEIRPQDLSVTLTTRLAYVKSGDARVDETSRQGLLSLSRVLARRTSLTPGDPVAVDPARDELAFYPMLYWPIVATSALPNEAAKARTAAFMKQGGTIVFDTRDALAVRPGGAPTPEALWLRRLLEGVDIPELEPVPADHVVTKAFYLIDGFIGRYVLGQTWIEALPPVPADGSPRPARAGDSVSPIVITSNDLAAGWASEADGESLYPLMPGGRRQHELALRGGINLVMYMLTGNYKADQVHVRDLLERLGH